MTYTPDTNTPTNGSAVPDPPVAARIDAGPPRAALHGVKRHPEDPPGAIETAVGEESLLDPDANRVNAVALGKGLQSVDKEIVDEQLEAEYDDGLGEVRKGAVEGQALAEAAPHLEKEETTSSDVEGLVADGAAALDAATRAETEELPHRVSEMDDRRKEHEAAVDELDSFEDLARQSGEPWGSAVTVDPVPAGGPIHWVEIAAKRAVLLAVFEVVLGMFALAGPLGEAISLDFPFGSVLVAAALSLTLVLLGWFGGKALAAVELPVRAVSAGFVIAAIWIIWHAAASLDALRVGETIEGKKILTAATLASIYGSALVSYAAAVYAHWARRREQIVATPTPVALWQIQYRRLNEAVAVTKAALGEAIAKVEACLAKIEALKLEAAGTDGRCRRREALGTKAKHARETIEAIKNVQLRQEDANTQAAIAAARMAYEKARAEEYPEAPDDDAPADDAGKEGAGLSLLHKLAILALVVGAIGGLIGSQIVLTLGAAAAALLLLLAISGWTPPGREAKATAAATPRDITAPVTTLAGDTTAPGWKQLPTRTTPKHGTTETDPTQHH